MASSSSTSHDYQSWTHDVFLSFRGEDTRKSFVGHLYTALEQAGINTYKDDVTLDRGESIAPALLKAIEESQIAVIVFSENYANSSWCLDELAHIIKCMDEKKQIVMPVFYDIDPSDVRKLKREHTKAFEEKHDESLNNNKVESWRKALVETANLSGWVLSNFNGDEAACIKVIVDNISSRLFQLLTNVNKDFIGIETRIQDLKAKLEIGSGGVRMVGIWGVGGSGKTTLASAAFIEISQRFEGHWLLQNVREESNKHGLKTLQQKFLSLVLEKDVGLGSEIQGRSMIQRRLCNKKVLLVLDDVDDLKQLNALAGSHDWFGEGSRIIITTRDKHVLTRHADTIYEVNLLSHDEATKLFCRHACKNDKPKEGYESLTQNIVSYAAGLPLALEVLGSFLYDKDKDEWESAFAKLKCIPNDEVMQTLKISYDGLDSNEKELFLDIACFYRRWEISGAMMLLDAWSFFPKIGVKVLIQRSLINVSTGKVDMHDLIEEMAHNIVREKHPNNPEKHSRIWKVDDTEVFCDMVEDAPLMKTEALHLRSDKYDSRLPDVVANMKKLRYLDWEYYPTFSFPSNFKPTQLRCLDLWGGKLKQLWEGYKRLPNLKTLELKCLGHLTKTPDFKGLPCLERLIFESCDKLEEIHPSIGYCNSLVYVDMYNSSNLKTFPPIISMKNLETLLLTSCKRLQKFPDIQTSMCSLVNLDVSYSGLEIIPESVGQFCTNLVSLNLSDCYQLKSIEADFRLLKSLQDLDFRNCARLGQQSLASVSWEFTQFLCSIKKLCLSGCNLGDGDVPYAICDLLNLELLDLSANQFSRLDLSLSQIPRLKHLELSACRSLVQLPDLPSSIAIVKANFCDSLQSVGDLSNYKRLWKVSLWRFKKLPGCERLLHSMLQVSAIEERFMHANLPYPMVTMSETKSVTLQLPDNWHSDFGGFLFCVKRHSKRNWRAIVIKHLDMSMGSQIPDNDYWDEFDQNHESNEFGEVGCVPFGSLRHVPWWSPASTKMISFEADDVHDFKVGLVPRKSKTEDDLMETSKQYDSWEDDKLTRKTFDITYDTWSSNIRIKWRLQECPGLDLNRS